jgi:hypothetical protein
LGQSAEAMAATSSGTSCQEPKTTVIDKGVSPAQRVQITVRLCQVIGAAAGGASRVYGFASVSWHNPTRLQLGTLQLQLRTSWTSGSSDSSKSAVKGAILRPTAAFNATSVLSSTSFRTQAMTGLGGTWQIDVSGFYTLPSGTHQAKSNILVTPGSMIIQ